MKWSIVTPFLDAASFLDRSVTASLSALDGHDGTLLLVDDGSTDAGPAIAREWSRRDARVVVRSTGGPHGPGAARNLGLADVDDGWVAFVDADDYLVPGALHRIEAAIAARPTVDLVAHSRPTFTATGPDAFRSSLGDAVTSIDLDLQRDRYLQLRTRAEQSRYAVPRELIGDEPFREGQREDVDALWHWWRAADDACLLDAEVLHVEPTPGSVSRTVSRAHVDGFVNAWTAIGNDLAAHPGRGHWPGLHLRGAISVLAVQARGVLEFAGRGDAAAELIVRLHKRWTSAFPSAREVGPPGRPTTYCMAADVLLTGMDDGSRQPLDRARQLIEPLESVLRRRWTCEHLKRDPELFDRINAGEVTNHDDCPLLEHRAT